ncbi:uncharacterized protein LOC114746384 [Neltuma alba]|uniref:uncharacterized protein LOC114746384 n=1 Tax=Neltuma alba TaxID=207710 RepID=UPI0010A351C4|nr:uncharacterized protein LOC114746384 [Prosopis alba]
MIIVWNARGAAGREFGNVVKELKRRYKPDMVVLIETRCSGENAQKAIKRMNFKFQEVVEANGMSGGIWVLWDSDDIKFRVIMSHKQFLHGEVQGIGTHQWIFTAVYASPRERERRDMWLELHRISLTMNMPWLVAGDFNDITGEEEQRGEGKINENKCRRFSININRCRLIDLGSEGPKYTWKGPMVQYASRLYKRLDRALCNVEWRHLFGETVVKVGPCVNSNHHPLLITLYEEYN